MRNRAGLVLAISVAVLVLLAVVAGVLSANRSGPELTEGSPEAAVQDYMEAVLDGDPERAATFLDPDGRCTAGDIGDQAWDTTARVVLRDSRTDGQEATVRVEFVYGGDSPLGGSEWRDDQVFTLRQVQQGWVVTGDPWPMHHCEGRAARP
jgi:hypothetical protein